MPIDTQIAGQKYISCQFLFWKLPYAYRSGSISSGFAIWGLGHREPRLLPDMHTLHPISITIRTVSGDLIANKFKILYISKENLPKKIAGGISSGTISRCEDL